MCLAAPIPTLNGVRSRFIWFGILSFVVVGCAVPVRASQLPVKIVSYTPSLEPSALEALSRALAAKGVQAVAAPLEPVPGAEPLTAVLAARLVEWEELLDREAPVALVVSGDDDTALAAAVSAAKLELPTAALGAGALVNRLASLSISAGDLEAAASEIAAWAEALPRLSGR